jgi:hypothetical protein
MSNPNKNEVQGELKRFEQLAQITAKAVTEFGAKMAEVLVKHAERINSIKEEDDAS